ncbi:protein trichome birefringence-like 6 [Dorcoceras hygrometricum]|uniref:Protein trichome birefringence-like 6 n=1 Tax=Dorcoceras hygrometricum TaxID=472368 RepID=A0A2Z7BQA2_9LAMI|nr:protein trichome birefringence-like 6 [Dorcoceras hygrometricum]
MVAPQLGIEILDATSIGRVGGWLDRKISSELSEIDQMTKRLRGLSWNNRGRPTDPADDIQAYPARSKNNLENQIRSELKAEDCIVYEELSSVTKYKSV